MGNPGKRSRPICFSSPQTRTKQLEGLGGALEPVDLVGRFINSSIQGLPDGGERQRLEYSTGSRELGDGAGPLRTRGTEMVARHEGTLVTG